MAFLQLLTRSCPQKLLVGKTEMSKFMMEFNSRNINSLRANSTGLLFAVRFYCSN